MYARIILIAALFWAPVAFSQPTGGAPGKSGDRSFRVQINKNVELLGFVYFLGYEGPESEKGANYPDKYRSRYAYGLSVYQRYKPFAQSRHLAVAMGFAETIWLDYLINLLLQLDDFPNARLPNDLDPKYYVRFSPGRDTPEARKNAAVFVEALNQLYREVDFDAFLRRQQPYYANALDQVRGGLPAPAFLPALEGFYQGRFDSYNLLPSLMIPPAMGFGVNYTVGGKNHAFHVFGAFGVPSFGDVARLDMGFNDKKHLRELSTHEFGHPFVNPVIDRMPEELLKRTQSLFKPIRAEMTRQGYNSWKICLYEHFVRAGEIVIAQNLGHEEDARQLRQHYQQTRRFIYLPLIVQELEAYNSKRDRPYSQAVEQAIRRLESEAVKP